MLASELIKKLNEIIESEGDKDIVFETNRHKYSGLKLIYSKDDDKIIMPLSGKAEVE